MEKLLFCAARDPKLKARLLSDRGSVLAEVGGDLTPSEKAMLAAIPDSALAAMIASINPENPWRRSFMEKVAGVASLAAATATVSCSPSDSKTRGSDPDPDVDGQPPDGTTTTGSGTSTDTSTDSDTGTPSDTTSGSDTPTPTGSGTPTTGCST